MDLVDILKNKKFIAQVHPWHSLDEGIPIYTLMVPVETALAETKLGLTKSKFLELLKANDVHVFRNIDEFVEFKDQLKGVSKKTRKQKAPRNITPERRKELQEHAASIRNMKQVLSPKGEKAPSPEKG